MPYRACIVSGCTHPAIKGASRCSKHGGKPRSDPGTYDSAWQANRAQMVRPDSVCVLDGRPGTLDDPLEVDHILPVARGGTSDPSNLRVIHRSENRRLGGNVRRFRKKG